MDWQSLHNAPRDRKVWLFLPSSRWTSNPDGTPKEVQHEAVLGAWDDKNKFWCVIGMHNHVRPVYPSLWHDAPVAGAAPEQPKLTA